MTIPPTFTLSLTLLSLLFAHATCLQDEQSQTGFLDPPSAGDSEIELEGFRIDESLAESIDHEFKSSGEVLYETTTRHPFEKKCPTGFFACKNGECIASKWRCDGHYDCDDFSDEINCTTIDVPNVTRHEYHPSGPRNATPPKIDVYGLDFNSSVEPLMLFSTGVSIRGLWMGSRIYFDIVSVNPKVLSNTQMPSITQAFSIFFDMFNAETHSPSVESKSDEPTTKAKSTIVGVDMDPNNKAVYWVELGKDPGVYSAVIEDEQFEARHRRQFHGHSKVVEYGLLAPEDIALDNVGRNAYITDAGLEAIVVCSILHSYCKIIASENIHKPRAIIADSSVGWVTYTDWGDHPGIYLVSMDGKRRETLIESDVVWPNGLAADYEENFLYWADARLNKIERVDLRTRKRYTIIKEVQTNPFSVSVFENRIYWSDWSGNDIKSCDKMTGNGTRNVMHADDIYGIHIYHPDIHKNEPVNPCWSKHCSHLCLLTPASATFSGRVAGSVGATCACPDSMALSIGDRSTCYEVQLSFVLVNEKNFVAQVFPDRIGLRTIEVIIYSEEHTIQDIASDWVHHRLFFFDASRHQIYSFNLAGRAAKVQKVVQTGRSVRGLLYDSWSDNLYWLDPEAGSLSLYSLKGAFAKTLRRNLDRPTSLALDSRNRLFYMAMLGDKPRIIRTPVGAERDLTLVDQDIGLPVALHLDEHQQRLYWADARRETIESVELDAKSRSSGVRPNGRVRHRKRLGTVLAFSVYHDSFMWTVQGSEYLYKARMGAKPDKRPVTFKLPASGATARQASDNRRIITVEPMYEVVSSPCQKRGCSHGCMLDQSHEAQCICPDGFRLEPANRTNCVESAGEEECKLCAQAGLAALRAERPDEQARAGAVAHMRASGQEAPEAHQFHMETLGAKAGEQEAGNRMVWLIVVLLLLSVTGLVAVLSLLVLYRQGRLPRQVSQLSVSFIAPGRAGAADKDRAMLLLDTDS